MTFGANHMKKGRFITMAGIGNPYNVDNIKSI